jgi:uncharacterized protein (TIGR01244 family)
MAVMSTAMDPIDTVMSNLTCCADDELLDDATNVPLNFRAVDARRPRNAYFHTRSLIQRHVMIRRRSLTATVAVALGLAAHVAPAQKLANGSPIANLPMPTALDTTGMFQAKFVRVGDDIFIGGQPTEKALRELKAQGVTVVINLRTPPEMQSAVKFDEPALIQQLGMRYVYLPMRGNAEFPYSPEAVTKLAEAVRSANGKVLLHCTIAWRASHLWAAYLIKERGVPVETALANARAINLMDTMRMGVSGRQPVEDFLNQSLPAVGHPPH